VFTQETDFTAGPDSHANDAHVGAPGRVRQVAVPPAARTLSTRSHSDYEDAFPIETDPAQDRTGGQWVRAILEDAPITMQRVLRWLLSAVGLQLGPFRSDGFVVGWEVRRGTPEFVLLGASGPRIGLSANLLLKRQQHTLSGSPSYNRTTRWHAVWAGVEPVHRPVVRYVLERASRRIREKERDG